jgi:hypothetical protein
MYLFPTSLVRHGDRRYARGFSEMKNQMFMKGEVLKWVPIRNCRIELVFFIIKYLTEGDSMASFSFTLLFLFCLRTICHSWVKGVRTSILGGHLH